MRLPQSTDRYYDKYEISDVSEAIEFMIGKLKSPVRFKIVMDEENKFHVELYGTNEELKKLFFKFAK